MSDEINHIQNEIILPPQTIDQSNKFDRKKIENEQFSSQSKPIKIKEKQKNEKKNKHINVTPKNYKPDFSPKKKIKIDSSIKIQNQINGNENEIKTQDNDQTNKNSINDDSIYDINSDQNKINNQYYKSILANYLKKENTSNSPNNFLEKHQITSKARSKMIDWMIEVFTSFKCSDHSLFFCVNLMDRYFDKNERTLKISELHLIGVSSIFLAIKYEDVNPLKMDLVISKIAHFKLNKTEIIEKELDILEILNFDVFQPNILLFVEDILFRICSYSHVSDRFYEFLHKIATYLSKMVLYHYDLLKSYKMSQLAGGIIMVSLKMMQKIVENLEIGKYVSCIQSSLYLKADQLAFITNEILQLAKDFDKIYWNTTNLKKFHQEFFLELEYLKKNQINT